MSGSYEFHPVSGSGHNVEMVACEGCGCLLGRDARYRRRHAEVCAGKDLPDATEPTVPVSERPPVVVSSSRYSPSDVWPEEN